MFARRYSSPMAPMVRIMCQTTLDVHRQSKPQTDKKDPGIRPHSASKGKKKDTEKGPRQDTSPAAEDDTASPKEAEQKTHAKQQTTKTDVGLRPHSTAKEKGKGTEKNPQQDSSPTTEDGPSSAGEAEVKADDSLQITVRDVDQGRCFLEDKQLIETDTELSVNDLVEALISISVLCDMPLLTRNAVRLVGLLLDQEKLAGTGEAIINMIQCKVDDIVDTAAQRAINSAKVAVEGRIDSMLEKATAKAADSLRATLETTAAELQMASTAVATSATQISATMTSYCDTLKGSSSGPAVRAATLDIRVRAHEGIKTCQVLVDAGAPGQGPLPGASNANLVDAANKAARSMEGIGEHCFVSARRLNNSGVLLEMDSDMVASWISDASTREVFLSLFAPDATVKDQAFPLVVQFVPLHLSQNKTWTCGTWRKKT